MTHVNILAHGGTKSYGVHNKKLSSPVMNHVTVEAIGGTHNYGVFNELASSPNMTDVTVEGNGGTTSYGMYSTGSWSVKINHSIIDGYSNSIACISSGSVYVGDTQLKGGPVYDGAENAFVGCAGVYDEAYTFYPSTCP